VGVVVGTAVGVGVRVGVGVVDGVGVGVAVVPSPEKRLISVTLFQAFSELP